MNAVIEKFKEVMVQIATPYSTGTGFYLSDIGLVVTNEHVVHGNREVVVEGKLIARQLAKVLVTDSRYDLALLSCVADEAVPTISVAKEYLVEVGEKIVAIGHPYGMKFSAVEGIISNVEYIENDVQYYQHDAALSPGNSGGPLVNELGQVIGINSIIKRNSECAGFSLPIFYLTETLQAFAEKGGRRMGSRCENCSTLVFEDTLQKGFCHNCGSKIKMPNQEEEYEAIGVSLTIENILEACGYQANLARRGPYLWEVSQGSAKIFLTYYEPNGLLAGDAVLCSLPKENIKAVYEFLLRQNHELEGLTLSVKGNEIVLSLIIYDRYLSTESGFMMFERLFKKADDLDNILVENYGCSWIELR